MEVKTEVKTKGLVRDLGSSFYIEWTELDALVSQWAKTEIDKIAVNAMCDRDGTDCHIVFWSVAAAEKQWFVEMVEKYARKKEWLQEIDWPDDWKTTSLFLPECFTPPIVEAITGRKCSHAVATGNGVYFFEKECALW